MSSLILKGTKDEHSSATVFACNIIKKSSWICSSSVFFGWDSFAYLMACKKVSSKDKVMNHVLLDKKEWLIVIKLIHYCPASSVSLQPHFKSAFIRLYFVLHHRCPYDHFSIQHSLEAYFVLHHQCLYNHVLLLKLGTTISNIIQKRFWWYHFLKA